MRHIVSSAPDALETREWLEALDQVLGSKGQECCHQLLEDLIEHARQRGVRVGSQLNTPYCNTIAPEHQPPYPGDLAIERRITAAVRWNALAMVVRANRHSTELGGHLASYASAADLFETGFQHFFRADPAGRTGESGADMVFFQPHSAPGVYARAFLEGRLTEDHLANFRRETEGKGLSSYPHPWLMPHFWQFPTGSMGLGAITAVYQARFMHYLQNRGLLGASNRKVWAFVGDGEMDEPESLAGLTLAAREGLDNLIFVVNCNLQRLDGPVRGNGSIIQELERLFHGAGWNVIKLAWGSDWDPLFQSDREGVILRRLKETVDGEMQSYGANDGRFNRERFFDKDSGLSRLVSHMTDHQIDNLTRGGHDPVKIHAAFHAATRHTGQPTVILAQTKKGYGLGRWAESRMAAHQQKKLDEEALLWFCDRFEIPLSRHDALNASFYRPSPESAEMRYLLERRHKLGGFLPARNNAIVSLPPPARSLFAPWSTVGEPREMSTTVAFVRCLAALLKQKPFGRHVVPIVADEARTFGMQSLFRQTGIYSPVGQLYEPEDHADFLYYKEARDGQILEEGINEAGALSSWIAAGTSASHHGIPLLPVYIFYSIFGFQRVADLIWAAADSRARGFLVGATAGRTTLSGEGLQHQDGSSHLMASTIPTCRAYDPCYAHEVAVILEHGMNVLLNRREDAFYYLTVMNENYIHPAMPEGCQEGIVRGMYLLQSSGQPGAPSVQLLGSGTILREVVAAAAMLERDCGVAADVWSVTSFTELRWSALRTERNRRMSASESSWLEQCLGSAKGPVIAATDYVRAVPDLIRAWVPGRYVTLGTDGFGRSDLRSALRRFFEVDSTSIAVAAVQALASEGMIPAERAAEFLQQHDYRPAAAAPWEV